MIKHKLKKLTNNPVLFFRDFYRKHFFRRNYRSFSNVIDSINNTTISIDDFFGAFAHFFTKVPDETGDKNNKYFIESSLVNAFIDSLTQLQKRLHIFIWISLSNQAAARLTHSSAHRIKSQAARSGDLIIHAALNDECAQLHLVQFHTDRRYAIAHSDKILWKKFFYNRKESFSGNNSGKYFDLNPTFPIDIVYTWVNSADVNWRVLLKKFSKNEDIQWSRYTENDELRFSLRSIHMYMNWFRNIYVISNCQKPAYVGDNDRIRWIDHQDIIPQEFTPTFNSHVIESFLWHIEELSENFIYMNDDVFVANYLPPNMFHASNGCSVSHHEPYGMVNFLLDKEREEPLEPWEAAALRGAQLIESKFGAFPVQLHQHAPHCLRKSVCQRMEVDFKDAFDQLRRERFRSDRDISPVSFLYHHYAFYLREAVRGGGRSVMIRHTNYQRIERELMRKTGSYDFFCINDGGDSYKDQKFQDFKLRFMNRLFPIKFPGEIS